MKRIEYEIRDGVTFTICPYHEHRGVSSMACHNCKHFVEDNTSLHTVLCKYDDELKHDGAVCEPKVNDAVNHPAHYNDYDVECIEMMRRIWGDEEVRIFCKLNAFKYRMRLGHKDAMQQDFDKEQWYIRKANELCQH